MGDLAHRSVITFENAVAWNEALDGGRTGRLDGRHEDSHLVTARHADPHRALLLEADVASFQPGTREREKKRNSIKKRSAMAENTVSSATEKTVWKIMWGIIFWRLSRGGLKTKKTALDVTKRVKIHSGP